MMRSLLVAIAFIVSTSTTVFAETELNCPKPEESGARKPEYSAAQMSAVLCKAAEDGRLKPAADSLVTSCGVGLANGAHAVADGLADFAHTVGTGVTAGLSAGTAAVKGWVASRWSSGDDAAIAAENAARANGQDSQAWLQTAKSYYDASKLLIAEYTRELDHNFRLVAGTAWCIPWKHKLEMICQFVSQVGLDLASMKAVATATDKAAAAAKAVAEFMRKTNAIAGLKNMSLTERLGAAEAALKYQSEFKTVEKFGENGNLLSRIDPITREQSLHFEEFGVVDGKKVSAVRDIPRDVKTKAVDSNFETGRKLAVMTVEKSRGEHLLFIDVNNLGKVNYFKAGTQAGDEYLSRVGAAIRKNLRPDDRFFKNGGDELVVVLKTKDPAETKAVIQRIHETIAQDRPLQDLFKQERIAKASAIKAANGGGATARPAAPSPDQLAALLETARIRPSVSIGSTRIEGNWAADLAKAEKQAGQVKAQYKAKIGSESAKYANALDGIEIGDTTLLAKPAVLDPLP